MNARFQTPALPHAIGEFVADKGGYFAGLIAKADGIHALYLAPKAEGELKGTWGKPGADLPGARSYHDGRTNTVAMAEAGSKLAKQALALHIGQHHDYHLPARDELELLYRAFKPTEDENYTWRHGENPSAVPPTFPYTETSPAQTALDAFQADGAEAFEPAWYWSSTQYPAYTAWIQYFVVGLQYDVHKDVEYRARAVRSEVIG
ncbi:DUF1566 domain-containing protein [Chitiniphilus eburneus]|uniref:DUF1566 domain-containing protein n=1 Tax=Chitiniphilus eburneus TaxID=2571148 RepID=UPI0035D0C42B